ncbi:hypothetical protein TWF225_011353 [Orbilia oligospora]|nr:hypothetical protein TWF225_011353 [Orbilia oligospora]KAF3247810.1 hypothetical protein TWF128_008535 [Orbilia oligospora]KAF3247811.1 hypothetical protein TWF128_008535 [Orbilia oligospora]KAF3247812.1 hypothetical protein TWF128_008535 [Orbilia oligospora]KAF3266684.1 hypothetical protein TWF217_001467 [Orbilia oligospora]
MSMVAVFTGGFWIRKMRQNFSPDELNILKTKISRGNLAVANILDTSTPLVLEIKPFQNTHSIPRAPEHVAGEFPGARLASYIYGKLALRNTLKHLVPMAAMV